MSAKVLHISNDQQSEFIAPFGSNTAQINQIGNFEYIGELFREITNSYKL